MGLKQGSANCGPPSAFLWPTKNFYQAKKNSLFSFSNRLIPYKRIIDMLSVTILRVDYFCKRFKHIFHSIALQSNFEIAVAAYCAAL